MAIVYRLTYKEYGVYRNDNIREDMTDSQLEIFEDMLNTHCNLDNYPNGYIDEIENVYCDYRFAFDSIENLVDWFDQYLALFNEIGCLIEIWITNNYTVGNSGKQLVFDVEYSYKIGVMPINIAIEYM